jgi:hypothetical protein
VFGLDFANDVDHNEQLTTSAWTIAVVQGADPNPAVHLEGPPKVVVPFGSTAKTATIQRIGGLWPDVTYKVEAIVITDRGNTKSLWTHIRGVNS